MEVEMKPNAKSMGSATFQDYKGKWHPAIRDGQKLWYWPNISFLKHNTAQALADEYIADAWVDGDKAQAVVDGWNLWRES
jgi:hypothetical protein